MDEQESRAAEDEGYRRKAEALNLLMLHLGNYYKSRWMGLGDSPKTVLTAFRDAMRDNKELHGQAANMLRDLRELMSEIQQQGKDPKDRCFISATWLECLEKTIPLVGV